MFDESKYTLGKLCKRGHEYENTGKSLRLISTRQCIACNDIWFSNHKANKAEYDSEYRETNKTKILESKRQYHYDHRDSELDRMKSNYRDNFDHYKDNMLQYNYGINLDEYNQLYNQQNGVCAICGNPETSRHKSGKVKSLAVDHDHNTGVVRGLLCHRCNSAIGSLNEDRSIFERAFKYLFG